MPADGPGCHPQGGVAKRCPRCQTAFTCGSSADGSACWCAKLPQIMRVPEEPAQRCLCPDCLRRAIAGQAKGTG